MKSKKNKNKNLGAYYNFLVTFVMRNKKYQTKPLLLVLVRRGKKGVVLPYHFVIYE
jgi:hypothetical protein